MSNVTKELSGEVTGVQASKILPMVKRVEVRFKGQDGNWYDIRLFKGESQTFLKEHPEVTGEVKGDTLHINL